MGDPPREGGAVARAKASKTQIGGYLLAAAGALLVLAFISPVLGLAIDGPILNLLFHAAMTVGFALLAVSSVGPARIAFALAALGWLIRIASIFGRLDAPVGIANLFAVFGGLVGAALLVSGRRRNAGGITLVIAMLLGVIYVFPSLVPFLPGQALGFVPAVFGAALIVAGILLPRRCPPPRGPPAVVRRHRPAYGALSGE